MRVLITLDERVRKDTKRVDEVLQRARALGFVPAGRQSLRKTFGIVSGDISRDKVTALKALDGVAAVEAEAKQRIQRS